MKIILASSSPRRKQLLEQTRINFEVDPSNYEEDMSYSNDPHELAKFLSLKKAQEVSQRRKEEAIIIGADSIISCNGKIYGKPHTQERAKEMLTAMSGKTHEVITGYTLINTKTNQTISNSKATKVFFKNLKEEEINSYIATGEPLDKAGAYAIQEKGAFLVDKIEGDYNNVVGLPISDVISALEDLSSLP